MRRSIHAEWTKLRTVPSNLWTMLAVTGLLVAVTALVTTGTEVPHCEPQSTDCATKDTTALALSGVYSGQLAVIILAVAAMSSEYRPMMIRTTLAANPRRATVFAAKAIVVTVAALAVALPGVLGSLLAGRAILAGRGFTVAAGHAQQGLTEGSLQRAAIGTVLYLLLIGLLSLGVAAVVRHSGSAIGVIATLLYGSYLFTQIVPMSAHTLHLVQQYTPMTAGLAVQTTVEDSASTPISPVGGLAVLAAYAVVALAVGGVLLQRRDA
jgi:ABC-2 type transport system permease protein